MRKGGQLEIRWASLKTAVSHLDRAIQGRVPLSTERDLGALRGEAICSREAATVGIDAGLSTRARCSSEFRHQA